MNVRTEDEYRLFKQPYFSFTANFKPYTFQMAGDIGLGSGINPFYPTANPDNTSYTKINGALRVSGERIFNRVTFDAIYKFRGGDPNTEPELPSGTGISVHTMGLYANIMGISDFGIGAGYTGLFRVYGKKDSSHGDWETRSSPYFSGVDLRLQYTGISRLTITSHNNASFAAAKGSDNPKNEIMSVNGGNALPLNAGENWFALYNGLGTNYKLSSQLSTAVQAVNKLTSVTLDESGNKTKTAFNQFGATAFIAWQFNPKILAQTGMQILFDSVNHKSDAAPLLDISGNTMYFAIPLRLKVVF
jgi:hypothetical protein